MQAITASPPLDLVVHQAYRPLHSAAYGYVPTSDRFLPPAVFLSGTRLPFLPRNDLRFDVATSARLYCVPTPTPLHVAPSPSGLFSDFMQMSLMSSGGPADFRLSAAPGPPRIASSDDPAPRLTLDVAPTPRFPDCFRFMQTALISSRPTDFRRWTAPAQT